MSRIHEYLPETLKDVIDLKLLNEDLDIELEQLDGYITGIGKEVIVESASLYGIQKWEKALGITPKDGDSLETRRFRVNNLLTSKLPYTYRWLIQKLTQITGSPSGYTLNINQDDYAITIVLSGLDTNMMIEVQKQLRNAIPSNMVLEIGGPPLVSADIKVGMALRIGTKYIIKSAKTGLPAGKNWFNTNEVQIGKAWNNNSNSGRAVIIIPVEQNIPYTISMNGNNTMDGIYVSYSAKTLSENAINGVGLSQITTFPRVYTSSTNYIILQFNKSSVSLSDIENLKLQVEKGSTATDYEPFIEL